MSDLLFRVIISDLLFRVIIEDAEEETKELTHIDNVRIERSLENLAYGFSCTCVPKTTVVRAGDKIKVLWIGIDGKKEKKDPIFSGYVDEVRYSIKGGSGAAKTLTINARSFVCDLLDSSGTLPVIRGNLYYVATQVARHYGVNVYKYDALKLGYCRFWCNGTSPFEVLRSLVREQGGILASNGHGYLELAVAREGVPSEFRTLNSSDIVEFDYTEDLSSCFHSYSSRSGSLKLEEKDERIRKTRSTQLQGLKNSIKPKLQNERNKRYGMSEEMRFVLKDWGMPGLDTHWFENTEILIDAPELGIKNKKMFVYGVILSLSKFGGYGAKLSCCHRDAYLNNERLNTAATQKKSKSERVKEKKIRYLLSIDLKKEKRRHGL